MSESAIGENFKAAQQVLFDSGIVHAYEYALRKLSQDTEPSKGYFEKCARFVLEYQGLVKENETRARPLRELIELSKLEKPTPKMPKLLSQGAASFINANPNINLESKELAESMFGVMSAQEKLSKKYRNVNTQNDMIKQELYQETLEKSKESFEKQTAERGKILKSKLVSVVVEGLQFIEMPHSFEFESDSKPTHKFIENDPKVTKLRHQEIEETVNIVSISSQSKNPTKEYAYTPNTNDNQNQLMNNLITKEPTSKSVVKDPNELGLSSLKSSKDDEIPEIDIESV